MKGTDTRGELTSHTLNKTDETHNDETTGRVTTDGGRAALQYQPRTDPPSDGIDTFERFSRRLSETECDGCGCTSLDLWITEGATSARAVCPACGTNLSDEQVRARLGGADR